MTVFVIHFESQKHKKSYLEIVYKQGMTIYRELDSMPDHRIWFSFNGKGKYIVKVKIPNIAYLNKKSDI